LTNPNVRRNQERPRWQKQPTTSNEQMGTQETRQKPNFQKPYYVSFISEQCLTQRKSSDYSSEEEECRMQAGLGRSNNEFAGKLIPNKDIPFDQRV